MGLYMARLIVKTSCIVIRFLIFSGKRRRSKITSALKLIVLPAFFLVGCSGDPVITPDSELTLSPPSSTYEIQEAKDAEGNCIFSSEFYQDVPIRLVVTDGLGRAIYDAPVTVYVDYAGNTFSGRESLQLYSDMNGNGVIDTLDELISSVGDEAFRSRTDNESGVLDLLLRINLSCSYRGNLYAFSGPAAAVGSIAVNEMSVETEQQPEVQDPLLEDDVLVTDPVTIEDVEDEPQDQDEILTMPDPLPEDNPVITEEPQSPDQPDDLPVQNELVETTEINLENAQPLPKS